ncbi:PAS domain-containing sensor histidine kinase [Paenibacillus sp. 1001270B_150601_E10]|uniref:PAS domain-containing sensor histidine kinase n=1 Tax=Paenibacillus sp. 1001270B_150601_E10 TaxID=2787079 RepID=UPI00189CD0D4|nr:PAS domain-containing sensor histidine kinase [Paenibacillus sp. 1001270B_150601_E10]
MNNVDPKAHRNLYSLLFHHHPDAVFILNRQGELCYFNPACAQLFGTRLQVGQPLTRCIHTFEIGTFHHFFKQALKGKPFEFRLVNRNGEDNMQDLKLRMVPNILDETLKGVTLYVQNPTEEERDHGHTVQADLLICQSFIEYHRDPILLLDQRATIVLANPAFSKLLGWSKEKLVGSHILDCPAIPSYLVKQMKRYYQQVVAAERHSDIYSYTNLEHIETIQVASDGNEYRMLLSISPIYQASGSLCYWAVHLRNITDKHLLEDQLNMFVLEHEVSDELSNLEHLKTVSHLAASISHEVRNPLTATRGFIQLLREPAISEDKKQLYIQISLDELSRAESIITDYLTFAKPSLEHIEHIDLEEELHYIGEVIKPFASMQNAAVQLILSPHLHIVGDRKKLQQALLNLMKNGVESMKNNGKLTLSLEEENDRVVITIQDNGTGMSPEQLKKLGTPYFTTKEKGTGLGTMVAFSMIRSMEGEISVSSELGKGTCITASFPKHVN